ncbi:MAG: hypothetical protein AAF268_16265 [Cyanobacteria bacterium P01_A01_bin.3]
MPNIAELKIGELLVTAGLLSEARVQVALLDKNMSDGQYRTGEILAMRGWVQQETTDFFVDVLPKLATTPSRLPLGEYLTLAHLLTSDQVDALLKEQKQCGVRLGSLAVMHGWIPQRTLDFLLEVLFPERQNERELAMRVVGKTVSFPDPDAEGDEYDTPDLSPDPDVEDDPWSFDHGREQTLGQQSN